MGEIEQRARKWAKEAKEAKDSPNTEYSVETCAAIDYILTTTDEPTMADMDWSWEKHRLAGAILPNGEEVVMIRPSTSNNDNIVTDFGDKRRKYLTPTGERYKLVKVTSETVRPKVLETEEDYENAPEGTIVDIHGTVAKRGVLGWYLAGFEGSTGSGYMANLGEGVVAKWGSEK